MKRMFKLAGPLDAIVCQRCMDDSMKPRAAELFREHFPGTYDRLECSLCGTGAEETEPGAVRMES